jgi:hypothetical protein
MLACIVLMTVLAGGTVISTMAYPRTCEKQNLLRLLLEALCIGCH